MLNQDDRLEDARRIPEIRIETAAFQLLESIGPVAWTVYTYIIYCSLDESRTWPRPREIADNCAIPETEALESVRTLIDVGLIGRHVWSGHPDGRSTYSILPAARQSSRANDIQQTSQVTTGETSQARVETAQERHQPPLERRRASLATDRLVTHEENPASHWLLNAQERRAARDLFDSFVTVLGLDSAELSAAERNRVSVASKIVGEFGGTPEQVIQVARQFRRLWPERRFDPVWVAEHWAELMSGSSESNETAGSGQI